MRLRVIELDGAITSQTGLLNRFSPDILDLSDWGPTLRMTCRFGSFDRFQRRLDQLAGPTATPALTFLGSGDFHHVSLALLERQPRPFNLLVVDKHPDWMRGVPVMHCGTWLHHALRLPNLRRVFHIGGNLDFDNWYRWLAPWSELRSGRVTVIPAFRRYRNGNWSKIPHQPLMEPSQAGSVMERLDESLQSSLLDLARFPLYISLDKDSMSAAEAVVNWDSGTLAFEEVRDVLSWFHEASFGNLAGMDVVGDWSPVRMRWGLRKLCHWIEHPALRIAPEYATRLNEAMNEAIIELVSAWSNRLPSTRLAPTRAA